MADSPQTQHDGQLTVSSLAELVQQQAEAIKGLKSQLSKEIKRGLANTTQQLEAHQALQALIGDLPAPLHGWPISPDFALQLVRLIRDNCYDLIVEFGSGTSTLLCLRTLEQFNLHSTDQETSLHRLITFEHLKTYYQKTTDLVASSSNRALLDLRLSPLEPWEDATGEYSYYAGTEAIRTVIQEIATSTNRRLKILVVIDGPPGKTCRCARYPGVPIVLNAGNGMNLSVDFLLDDMIRSDEKETAIAWEKQFQAFDLNYKRIDYHFAQGGFLLSVDVLVWIYTYLARSTALATDKQDQETIATLNAQVDELFSNRSHQTSIRERKSCGQQQAIELEKLASQLENLKLAEKARDEQGAQVMALGELSNVKEALDAEAKEQLGTKNGSNPKTASIRTNR